MAFQVLFQKLAFQKTKADDPTMPDGPEEIVARGGLVPDYVPTFVVSALANSGMVAYVADPDPAVVPAAAVPEQPRLPEQPVVLPNNPNSPPVAHGDLGAANAGGGGDGLPPLPATADNKATWEAFAQQPFIGMSEGDAEAMNKTDLMAEVRTRYAAAEAGSGV